MSENDNLDAALQYHSGTKHTYQSIRMHPNILDWDNKPLLFKIYPTLEVTRLPRDFTETKRPALSAISAPQPASQAEAIPDLETLAQLLFFSAGVIRSKKYPQGETFFRAAACTGALYEIELYIVCTDLFAKEIPLKHAPAKVSSEKHESASNLPGGDKPATVHSAKEKPARTPALAAGLYHFGVAEFGLRQLRAGDFRQVLVDATGEDPAVAHAPVIIVCTGTYWRNAWKYHSRTYRHFGWDNGTILANLLAMSAASNLPASVIAGFMDSPVNNLLGLDIKREVAFSLVPIGYQEATPPKSPQLELLELPVVPYSQSEVEYPAMRKMHEASSLTSVHQAATWPGKTPSQLLPSPKGKTTALQPLKDSALPADTIEQVISRRGSTRQFARDAITLPQLSTMLDRATRGISADFLDPFGSYLNDLYLIVNNVQRVLPGAYVYHRENKVLELLKSGDFRDKAGYLALEQQLAADAAVDIFFLADLKRVMQRYGNRGYRAAQLEAGIIGGKLYLAAYAQHLGATGLTFYDDDVVSFFSPHARGKSAIFLVALGRPAQRKG